ncbi:MAG: GNAT family N-acetyltransferase [Brevundimonas sp.]
MTTLITERLTLIPVAATDYDELRIQWSDAEFIRHIVPEPLSGEDVWFRILRDIGHWETLGYGNWTVRLRETGEHVGGVGVLDFRRELQPAFEAPELGWGVNARFQGKGLAFEAVSAALAWCDDTLNAPRTCCMISPDNRPSMALAERVGFAPWVETTYKGEAVVLLERLSA